MEDVLSRRLDEFIFYLLCALVFVVPILVFPYSADIFELPKVTLLRFWVLLIAFVWTVKIYRTGNVSFRRTSLDLPVIFFGFVSLAATIFSINPLLSLLGSYYRYEGIFTIVAYIALFFITTQFVEQKRFSVLLYTLLASTAANAVYGIFQHYGYDFIKLTGGVFELARSSGTLGNPVFLGALLVSTISLPVAILWREKSVPVRLLALFVFLLLAVSLAFTSTRAAWLGFAAVLLVLALFLPPHSSLSPVGRGLRRGGGVGKGLVPFRNEPPTPTRVKVVALVLLIALFAFFLLSRFYSPPKGGIAERAFSIVQPAGSAGTRLDMWKGSLFLVSDRPLLGSGWENFEGTFPRYGTKFLMSQEELPDRPHNQFLYTAASAGLLGALAYLWLIITVFGVALKSLFSSNISPANRIWIVGLLAGITGYVIQEQFSISSAGVTPLFWIFLGLIAGYGAENDRSVFWRFSSSMRTVQLVGAGLLFLVGSIFNLQFLYADMLYRRGMQAGPLEGRSSLANAVQLQPYLSRYRSALARSYTEEAYSTQNPQLLQEARFLYEEGLRFDPRDEGSWIELGDLYSAQGDTEKAVKAYKRVLDLHPLSAGARWALGDLYLAQGKYGLAVANLEKASSLVPQHTGVLLSLATAYQNRGDAERAIKIYRRVLEIEPDNEQARNALAGHEFLGP